MTERSAEWMTGYKAGKCNCRKDENAPERFIGVHADTEAKAIQSWNDRK